MWRCGGAMDSQHCRTPVSFTAQRQQYPEAARYYPLVGVKQGKVVFQPDGSNTTASTSGSAPSAGANPVLDRARKSKAQMAKITTGGRERVINGDDGGGELWSDGAAETYATRFLTVDGGGRPLVVQSMPNSRPYYPWRREEGRPANEEEAGNLAAVVRR